MNCLYPLIEKMRRISFLLFLTSASGLLLATILAGCRPLQSQPPPTTPDPSLEACTFDQDCTLGLRIDQCCPCPIVTTRALVGADYYLVFYFSDTDYKALLPEHCREAVCGPCPPLPEGLFCLDGSCARVERQD
jgi:hypothetical protein